MACVSLCVYGNDRCLFLNEESRFSAKGKSTEWDRDGVKYIKHLYLEHLESISNTWRKKYLYLYLYLNKLPKHLKF